MGIEMRSFITLCFLATPALADGVGVDTAVSDPPVVPLVRAPDSDFQGAGTMVTSGTGAQSGGSPYGQGAHAGPTAGGGALQPQILGYQTNIAWDHVAVGIAILGGMYLFGESEAASSSN
jgi:hypothetical protein